MSDEENHNVIPEDLGNYKVVRTGDLVINKMKAWQGSLGIAEQEGIVSPAYFVYELAAANRRYAHALLRSRPYVSFFGRASDGVRVGQWDLSISAMKRIPVLLPPTEEQDAIVRYLASADRRIRRYVRAKQSLIALLEEQKRLVVHRAVTRGLDPDAPLKPSGVEWLGDVPAHWEVKRLKWVTRLQRGYDLPQEQRVHGPHPVVSSGGIIDTHAHARVRAPGVVLGRYGSTDAVFYIESDFWPHNTALFVTDFHGNDPRWCFHMLRTISKADHAGKSAVPGVDRKDLYEIEVAQPSTAEQRAVVREIEERTAAFDEAIARARQQIKLVTEYRTRLVADVVTGKLDVRAAAARLPNHAEELDAPPLDDADAFDADAAEDAPNLEPAEA